MGSSLDRVLLALAEALWPSLPCGGGEDAAVAAYLATSGADCPQIVPHALSILDTQLYGPCRDQLKLLLLLLDHRLPTALLAGRHCLCARWPFVLSLPEMPVAARQAALMSWCHSTLAVLRQAYKGIKGLLSAVLLSHVDPATGTNPFWAGMRFTPGTAAHAAAAGPPPPGAAANEELLASATLHLPQLLAASGGVASAQALLARRGFHIARPDSHAAAAANGGADTHASSSSSSSSIQLHYDAVIVGSGAGGGVTAAVLAAAGLRVLVLEKGSWVRRADMTWQEAEAFEQMYERAGFMLTSDGGLTMLAGATLGGGTAINWTASLTPPPHVREEWAAAPHHLAALGPDSAAFDAALEAVCRRLGVATGTQLSTPNQKLLQGMHALGLHAEEYPRNCSSKTCTAFCNLGCRTGHKQSSEVWLADAVRAGAHVLTGVHAQQVLTVPRQAEPGSSRRRRAVGVLASVCSEGTAAPALLTVHAPIVVSSCGSIHTPALLLRSGISGGGRVGANLRLHPASGVVAVFPQQQQRQAGSKGSVNMFEGVSMAVYSCAASNRDAGGYGALLSVPACQPGLLAAIAPDSASPGSMKRLLLDLPDSSLVVVFTRDSSGGRVTVDRQGRPVVDYWPCAATRGHLMEGVIAAVRAMVAAGATRVVVPNAAACWEFACAPHEDRDAVQRRLDALAAEMRATGVRKFDMPLFSAHQMGSCHMGASRATSAVDPCGAVWDVDGLYVADGSLFPTPSGVNPMMTIYGVSHLVASGIAQRWKEERASARARAPPAAAAAAT